MKTKGSTAWLPALVLAAALTAGCAATTKASRDDREYSRTEYRNQFADERERCRAMRGRFVVQGWAGALDRDGLPRTRVRYHCV